LGKKYLADPGATVVIEVEEGAEVSVKEGEGTGGFTGGAGGLLPGYVPQDIALRRKRLEVRLYNLGTRLEAGGGHFEYVDLDLSGEMRAEVTYEAFNHQNAFTIINLELADVSGWYAIRDALLAGNPFSYTQAEEEGGRLLPNCLQLPHKASFFNTSLSVGTNSVLIREDSGSVWRREVLPDIAGEGWADQNLEDGLVGKEGVAKLTKGGRIVSVAVGSFGSFESFDTSSPKYKVTELPAYDSPTVELEVRYPLRIFLAPQLWLHTGELLTCRKEYVVIIPPDRVFRPIEIRGQAVNDWVAGILPFNPLAYPVTGPGEQGIYFLYADNRGVRLPLEDQPNRTMLEALDVEIGRITAPRKSVMYANFFGGYTDFNGEVRGNPFTLAELSSKVDATFEATKAHFGITRVNSQRIITLSHTGNIFSQTLNYFPEGQLLGVIQSKGGKLYYVWRKTPLRVSDSPSPNYKSIERFG
jgi:hypothetical protein